MLRCVSLVGVPGGEVHVTSSGAAWSSSGGAFPCTSINPEHFKSSSSGRRPTTRQRNEAPLRPSWMAGRRA
eukprot:CAMPEP_0174865456 /NCGR_PEP_ID=MMETSP1114-20130205/60406_1 /TAXON_ID=312471 /ORGANISM="Neobodo designis, Strain CCAP 1951/1" /LENGTH=70 /DNA_ID=CAMNT_0016100585 /DNA_START=580 /DNA_END=792 /DNA_ORIENTATION=+